MLSLVAAVALSVPSGPLVIAHRGASGERPEHTIEAYRLAIEQKADFIEPDLVMTKDGHLIARHENELSDSTDVADRPEFADRKATKTIDGRRVTGWFSEDLTLAEVRTLRARERMPQLRPASKAFDGRFGIPTFAEVAALARERGVGVYPEMKHPTYFREIGLDMVSAMATALQKAGLDRADAKVFVQCFEVGPLIELSSRTKAPLVQLLSPAGKPWDFTATGSPRTYADLTTPEGLAFVRKYAQGIGPNKAMVVPRGAAGGLGTPTSLVKDAHAAGLVVHAWTFRDEPTFLPLGVSPDEELAAFWQAGVDGVFTDFPARAVASRPRTARQGG